MNRPELLLAQFTRANPEVIISERADAGLWFEARQRNPATIDTVDDLEPRLVGLIHIPTLVAVSAALPDAEFPAFAQTVGHVVDIVWDVTAGGWPNFWDPPDWDAVRKTLVEENIEHAQLMVDYPFNG